jgi:cob(I)alamin adenosyltransferase
MKTFNKRGDKGETSLLYGGRVLKSELRCEAYGTIDEAVSALGLARNLVRKEKVKEIIFKIQQELFTVAAELATEEYDKFLSHFKPVTEEMVNGLEKIINEVEAEIEMPKAFIIPGSSPGTAALDLARAIVRRAERRTITLKEKGKLRNEILLQYLNRLADLLFALARYEEAYY